MPNFCFIPADLNREIGSRAPADYLAYYREVNPHFDTAAASHLLPVGPDAAIWQDNFEGFLKERAQLISAELRRLIKSKPGEFAGPVAVEPEVSPLNARVDLLEVRLRDFIDHRLAAVVGSHYWKPTMPGEVISYVKEQIQQHLDSHPYEDWSDYPLGRARLDFCALAHYEQIFHKNWEQFEESFGKERELERHMSAYRALRNALKHNREPSDIELENGQAAMKWLERILDKYDQENRIEIEDNGE